MTTTFRTVADAIAEVEQWQQDQASKNSAEKVEVDSQISALEAEIAERQAKLDSLRQFRAKLDADKSSMEDALNGRFNHAVLEALRGQKQALTERSEAYTAAYDAQRAAALESLKEGELATLAGEYEQFLATKDALEALPDSYKAALMAKHEETAAKLKAHLDATLSAPPEVAGDACALDVVFAVDAPEGVPELLVLLAPIDEAAHTHWAERTADLHSWLGARLLEGVYEATKRVGPKDAHAVCGGFEGLLVMEMELQNIQGDLAQTLLETLNTSLADAPALQGAKVQVSARQVDVDYILPSEETVD